MKRLIITTLVIFFALVIRANDKLVMIKFEDPTHLYSLFENHNLAIHYYTDNYIICSINEEAKIEHEIIVLDEKAFEDTQSYFIVYCPETQRNSYLEQVQDIGKVLYGNDEFLIMKPIDEKNHLIPAKNDGMVFISQQRALLPQKTVNFPVVTEIDPLIQYLTEMVNTDSIMASIQHLQDYGTRIYYGSQAYEAQDWLKSKYEAMGLEVEIQEFSAAGNWWGLPSTSSGNVIAIQTGTEYPDEYIVCGSHYDSITMSNYDNCPGADDNASGTAGILEIARILSQYEFERSIIYCNFSAEEVGLIGSYAYATRCNQQGMNILGYFNIDMSGYLKPGTQMHIDLIHPTSAATLANYYTNIANIYFPELPITSYPNLPGGDSDHTSFNQKGFMGIFPFEDRNNHSPYIHTANDIIGTSVNTPNQCRVFTQITFASITTLATAPIPDFSVSEITINKGSTVQFTDLSTNEPTAWHWFFEGGTPAESNEQNPEVLYETPGIFDVKLNVSNDYLSVELIKNEYITVISLSPFADFSVNNTNIIEGNSVLFTDLSTNEPTEWFWYFEGGTPAESNEQNPEVLYETPGIYDVKLIVSNNYGNAELLKNEYITVAQNVGIIETDDFPYLQIFPNPTKGELVIENIPSWRGQGVEELGIEKIEIFDVLGIMFQSFEFNVKSAETKNQKHETIINISHLPSGIYFIKITTEEGVITKKIVKY